MKRQSILNIVTAFVVTATLAGGGYALYRLGMTRSMPMPDAPLQAGDIDPATGQTVLYWHDPMVPGQRFEQPGKSPFMDMMLVPVYSSADGDAGSVAVSSRVQQNLGIRTVEVTRGALTPRVAATGNIAFDERDQVIVQARSTAFVERLHVRATLDPVRAGQALVDLYVPEWVAAQQELLSLKRMRGSNLADLIDAARQRMALVGMSDEQIRQVEASGAVQARVTLTAPIGGVVADLPIREGATVMPGATLLRINGLATVWVNAAVPESQAQLLRPGAAVEARSAALPGVLFAGTVQAVLPEVDPVTRTLTARVELRNEDRRLVPGMFVSVALAAGAYEGLLVPTEAVIRTGTRTVVILAETDAFRPVDVEAGIEADGQTLIASGLQAGQRVVASGQFLIDSEASLRATSMRMEGMPAADSSPAATQP